MKPTLKDYFEASFPVLFLDTLDTEGVTKECRRIIKQIDESGSRCLVGDTPVRTWFGSWTWTRYLQLDTLDPVINPEGVSLTEVSHKLLFEQALEFIRDSTDSMVIIFHHVRGMFTQMKTVQLLIDTAEAARKKFSTIIFVGHYFDLPPELANVVQYVEVPLPDKKELIDLCVDRIILPNVDLRQVSLPDNWENLSTKTLRKEIIDLNEKTLTDAARAASGLDPVGAENAFALSLTMANKLDYDIITEQKRLLVKKSDVLEFIPLKETMSDVGGFDNYQQWLSKRAGAFTDDAKEFGVTPPRGILLVGVPGGGKSLCAKSTASSLKIPLIRFDLSKVFGSLVGQSESRMRGALKVAEAVAPCVLWLDEVEKALSGSSSGDHDTGVSARVLGQFLEWRAETTAEVFVCCTSNNIHGIPPEFYRPGRIDAIFYAGNPDLKGRIEILEIHLRKRGRSAKEAPNINYVEVAKATEGYTGAEIELAVIEAIFTAYNEGKRDLTTNLLLDAVKCIVPQSRRNKEDMVELEQWAKDRAIPVAKPAPEKQIRVARPIAKNFN